jgi:hypothetical protein
MRLRMKIEYLADGSADCPMIRIYGGQSAAFLNLLRVFEQLACGVVKVVAIHDLPGFEAVNGCVLTAKAGTRDAGVRMLGADNRFKWVLTPETWDNVAGLTEPFCKSAGGFQWLNGVVSDVAVLISGDGSW